MTKIKKILGFLLANLMLFAVMPIGVFASDGTAVQPSLYAFYGDGMLFQQKQEAILAGIGSAGDDIECRLIDENGVTVANGFAECSPDGKFEVGFTAPAGGFNEYGISVLANGKEFAQLKDVVFGELWLASGQSNMQFALNCTPSWENVKKNGYGSKWIRFLHGPDFPVIKGQDNGYIPNRGQDEYLGCRWLSASDPNVGDISGVGYFFAEELFEKINMPVGVLAVYLGGSPIRSWISRQTLENSPDAMKVLKSHREYVPSAKWDPHNQNYSDLASNYNVKIYPLRHFRPAGVVWYQGETELLCNYSYGEYSTMFDLLQKDFTHTFSHSNGDIPIVYTQLACYNYRSDKRDMQSLNKDISFSGAKIRILNGLWVSPEVNGSGEIKCTVPADGEWHIVELDLNKLYLNGNTLSLVMTNIILNEVYELEVCFEGDENENAVIDVDAFEFTHKAEQHSSFIANIPMRIHDFVSLVYELILKFFQKIVTPIGC